MRDAFNASWGIIVGTTLIQLWFFRRKRWI